MTTAAEQLKTLKALKKELYTKRGNCNPEVASQYAVEGILSMYRGQEQYLGQLLGEEIEDTRKELLRQVG